MFENVDCGMAMCDFTVLLEYINPRTLAPRGVLYEIEIASLGGTFAYL